LEVPSESGIPITGPAGLTSSTAGSRPISALTIMGRVVNGTDNFRSESASVSIFEDMVCIFRNPPDMDADADSAQADIRRIR
jgi:hypothetical protein